MRALQRNVGVRAARSTSRPGPSGDRRVTRFARGDFARLVLFGGARRRAAGVAPDLPGDLARATTTRSSTRRSGAILFRQNLTKFDAPAHGVPELPGRREAPGQKAINNAPHVVDLREPGSRLAPADSGPRSTADSRTPTRTSTTTTCVDARRGDPADAGRRRLRRTRSPQFPRRSTGRTPATHDVLGSGRLAGPARAPGRAARGIPTDRGLVGGQPQAERRPGVLPRQRVPRPPRVARRSGSRGERRLRAATTRSLVKADDGAGDGPDAWPGRRPRQQREHVDAAGRREPADADVPVRVRRRPGRVPHVPQRQRRRRRGDGLARVHARAVEPADHAQRRARAHLEPARGRDGGGVERLVRARPAAPPRASRSTRPRRRRRHRHRTRTPCSRRRAFEPIDCPARPRTDPRVPRRHHTGARGGYTFGDFGTVLGSPEVHSDGEIWTQTLWDLRTR